VIDSRHFAVKTTEIDFNIDSYIILGEAAEEERRKDLFFLKYYNE